MIKTLPVPCPERTLTECLFNCEVFRWREENIIGNILFEEMYLAKARSQLL